MANKLTGSVKWFHPKKGYGFIEVPGSRKDYFVHFSSIIGEGFKNLEEGQKVEFIVTDGPKGEQAGEVRVIG